MVVETAVVRAGIKASVFQIPAHAPSPWQAELLRILSTVNYIVRWVNLQVLGRHKLGRLNYWIPSHHEWLCSESSGCYTENELEQSSRPAEFWVFLVLHMPLGFLCFSSNLSANSWVICLLTASWGRKSPASTLEPCPSPWEVSPLPKSNVSADFIDCSFWPQPVFSSKRSFELNFCFQNIW